MANSLRRWALVLIESIPLSTTFPCDPIAARAEPAQIPRDNQRTINTARGHLIIDIYINGEPEHRIDPRRYDIDDTIYACKESISKFENIIGIYRTERGKRPLGNIVQRLVNEGSSLRKRLLLDHEADLLWGIATSVEWLVLRTNMAYVPWEVLFFGNAATGQFLGDCCTVTRMPIAIPEKRDDYLFSKQPQPKAPVTFIGSKLCSTLKVDADGFVIESNDIDDQSCCTILEYAKSQWNNVYETGWDKDKFIALAREHGIISWYCHNTSSGLQMDDDEYYRCDDAELYPFSNGSLVFIISCSSGSPSNLGDSVALKIFAHSRSMVLGSTIRIEGTAALSLLHMINDVISCSGISFNIRDIWLTIRPPDWRKNPSLAAITSLFFAVYGNRKLRFTGDKPHGSAAN